jgi:hypothetical protein
MAFGFLISALLATSSIVAPQRTIAPEWVVRAIYFLDFLLLGGIFYGLQTRKTIYWKLIPVLLGIFLLSFVIGSLWSIIQLSLPWVPFVFVIVLIFIGSLFFGAWWRKQKNYFV